MEKTGKILGAIIVGALCVGAGALAGAQMFPKEVQVPGPVLEKIIYLDKPVEVIKEVQVAGPEVVKTVIDPVTQVELDRALDFIQSNLNEDVTIAYIMFETDAQIEAEAYLRSDLVNVLDDNNMFDSSMPLHDFRKSEVSVKHISDPIIEGQDYDNKDATFVYEVKVRAYADKDNKQDLLFKVTIPFEKGNLVDSDVELEQI
jgi:hypothetical protein